LSFIVRFYEGGTRIWSEKATAVPRRGDVLMISKKNIRECADHAEWTREHVNAYAVMSVEWIVGENTRMEVAVYLEPIRQ